MTFWRSKTLLMVLLLAWITPAVALGGLAVHLELEHGHGKHGHPEHSHSEHSHDQAAHPAHHHGHQDHQAHGEHHHPPVAPGVLSCDAAEAHGAHFSDGTHHHHTLGLPGHDHELLPARGPVRLDTPSVQAIPPALPNPVARPSSPGRPAPPAPPPGPSPLLQTTVLLL